MITLQLLQALCPKTKSSVLEQYVEPLHDVAAYYEMYEHPKRLAAFLAQTAHESGDFNFVKENLNYSAKGLMGTFKKYFPDEATAKQYERNPQKIANRVYANRMGNGPEESGDGWRYRGRGLIQLTGHDNYHKCMTDLEVDDPEYFETPEGAVYSACWFWDTRNLNAVADTGDIKKMTKLINGGFIGLEDRIKHYEHALHVLGG